MIAIRRGRRGAAFAVLTLLALAGACGSVACAAKTATRATASAAAAIPRFDTLPRADAAFLDTLERRTFDWFWDLSEAPHWLTHDRYPTRSFASVAASGFALTAYPIGASRGYVTRVAAAERVRATLEAFWTARQDTARAGATGHRGLFYHFLDQASGTRFERTELSTIDTALLMAGVLFCQTYFDRADPAEARVRALAESLYTRVDWAWTQTRAPLISHGWTPEEGFLPYDWVGYDEAMILQILALGSPTHPASGDVWTVWTKHYAWGTFHGQEHLGFAPLFGHQYSHVWIDFRGIQDGYMRGHGIDYFENSRRATLAQIAYARENPQGFRAYGDSLWGLSACDGPLDGTVELHGHSRRFETYNARGASFVRVADDGTVAPTAAGGSIPFAPREAILALRSMRERYGEHVFNRHGFVDALNPTLDVAMKTQAGHIVPGVGWFDNDQLGIDQGPIVAMIENYRSDLVWSTMRRNPHVIRGLRRAGFTGGWLDKAPATP